MKSVCIFCGSADDIHPDYLSGARQMGATLARREITLVYGGGRTGVMGALADGVLEHGGQAIGIITEAMNTPALAHPGLTRLEAVPLLHQRKARMHELADGFIALPGGYGTLDELFEALTWAQLGVHTKPIGLLNTRNFFDPLMALLVHAGNEGFIFPEHIRSLYCESDQQDLLTAMESHRPPLEAVRRWLRQ